MGISPIDCKHFQTVFISSGHYVGTEGHGRHRVWICKNCGQIHVSVFKNGQYEHVTFELSTPEALEAAGQYMKWLEGDNIEL